MQKRGLLKSTPSLGLGSELLKVYSRTRVGVVKITQTTIAEKRKNPDNNAATAVVEDGIGLTGENEKKV